MVCSMHGNSHGANFVSTPLLRGMCNEWLASSPYHANMPRKSSRSQPSRPASPDWYLPEWMRTLNVKQSQLAKLCDWNTSTMHGIYHGRTEYYREIVNLIAKQLKIEPCELMMPP